MLNEVIFASCVRKGEKYLAQVFFCLVFQVNSESPSESVGLVAGDVIVAVNGQDITACRHKEAQDVIVRAGNNFRLSIQRYNDILVRCSILFVFFPARLSGF